MTTISDLLEVASGYDHIQVKDRNNVCITLDLEKDGLPRDIAEAEVTEFHFCGDDIVVITDIDYPLYMFMRLKTYVDDLANHNATSYDDKTMRRQRFLTLSKIAEHINEMIKTDYSEFIK